MIHSYGKDQPYHMVAFLGCFLPIFSIFDKKQTVTYVIGTWNNNRRQSFIAFHRRGRNAEKEKAAFVKKTQEILEFGLARINERCFVVQYKRQTLCAGVTKMTEFFW